MVPSNPTKKKKKTMMMKKKKEETILPLQGNDNNELDNDMDNENDGAVDGETTTTTTTQQVTNKKKSSKVAHNHETENDNDDDDDEDDDVQIPNDQTENKKKTKRVSRPKENGEEIDEEEDAVVAVPTEKETEEDRSHRSVASTTTTTTNENHHFYSRESFAALSLCRPLVDALHALDYTIMTHIQHQAIPPILMGHDVIGAAPTGSGKTLAFVIPTLHLLHTTKFTHYNGTGTIIITPTRELALQIYGVISDLCTSASATTNTTGDTTTTTTTSNSSSGTRRAFSQTYGLIMGGANRRTEAEQLKRGICIVVATPGRLLDHLQNTPNFMVRNLISLIIDEADRILEQGFEDDLRSILKLLPKSTSTNKDGTGTGGGRQTILFSATQTKRVQDLVRLSMNMEKSVFVDIPVSVRNNNNNNNSNNSELTPQATAVGIEQGYVTCPSDQRFLLLFTFLKKNLKKKKIMVFFSSCNSVKYHCELLNYIDIPCMDIHGRQKQMKRTTTFFQFCKNTSGILLCTDVAARGLDIPAVDWIIQFDPPDDPKEYIHRVGRTARGASGSGRALLFLSPQEIGFLQYLRAAHVTLSEYEFPITKIANIQSQYIRLIESNYYLHRAAKDAYRSYLLSYASHAHRNIFNVHELDLQGVATAFGFTTPPRVDINFGNDKKQRNTNTHNKSTGTTDSSSSSPSSTIIGKRKKGIQQNHRSYGGDSTTKEDRKKQRIAASASGHAFSADNPYGKRATNDTRQFSH